MGAFTEMTCNFRENVGTMGAIEMHSERNLGLYNGTLKLY